MTTITIRLADDQLAKLQQKAGQIGVSPEELARTSIEELLRHPAAAFEQVGVADAVLGGFVDDPALLDYVAEDAMRPREVQALRQPGE